MEKNIGIIPLLRKEGLVKRLESEIFDNIKDQEHNKIYPCKVGLNDYNIDYVAKIWMILKIRKFDIDKIVAMGEDVGSILHLGILPYLTDFFHQIEKVILRGLDKKGINFDCFFGRTIENEGINLISTVIRLTHNLKESGFNPPFILMSDFNTLHRAEVGPLIQTPEGYLISKKRQIENMDDIFKWIELLNDADKDNDHELVCIPKSKQNKPTFKLIEKSPLEVTFRYNGGTNGNLNYVIDICWYGALKIDDPNSIQRIKINLN